ncbi:MAG: autotransporter assembly complex family protein [Pseudomonadota bacterium]
MRESLIYPVRAALILALALVAGCADNEGLNEPLFQQPETAIDYETEITGLPDEEATALAEQALATFQREPDGAQSLAFLRRRASSDEPMVQKLLRSRGYYQGSVDITVTPIEPEDGTEVTEATVLFEVDPGPVFTLVAHEFEITSRGLAPELAAAEFGSPIGQPANAAAILDAENLAVLRLKESGFPYAARGKRRALADLEAKTIEVVTPIDAGPLAVYGALTFEGLDEVEEAYLRTYLDFDLGQTFSQEELEDYQDELLATDLFDSISVRAPDDPPEGEAPVSLPIIVAATEREKRTVGASARYNTDDGPSVKLDYENRNLFGANETFTAEAIAGLDLQSLTFGYREPQYLRDGQDFIAELEVSNETDDAFDAQTATLTVGISRRLNDFWTVGAGGLLEASLIDDNLEGESESYLFGIPLSAAYDGSDDLLNPTKGSRFLTEVTPFVGTFDEDFASFLTVDTRGSTYYDITGTKDYVLAARGRAGFILTDELETVPDTRRLYSGGGSSVRGFEQRSIGPLDAAGDPTGGLSVLELNGEFRGTISGDLGGVVFVDAGSVSEEIVPDFNEGVQVAAGVGIRYYSPAGPIRVDIAFPLNGREIDDTFQFYFSIGQAF